MVADPARTARMVFSGVRVVNTAELDVKYVECIEESTQNASGNGRPQRGNLVILTAATRMKGRIVHPLFHELNDNCQNTA